MKKSQLGKNPALKYWTIKNPRGEKGGREKKGASTLQTKKRGGEGKWRTSKTRGLV